MHRGFMHLASGMSVGLTGVAAGYTIGVVGDAVRILSFVIQLR
jgi:V-type H+-transporting ATPase proteolipid subunit